MSSSSRGSKITFLRIVSRLFLSISKGGGSTTSLGDPLNEVLIIPSATLSRRFYFLGHLKLSRVRSSSCPFILSTYALLYLTKIYLPEASPIWASSVTSVRRKILLSSFHLGLSAPAERDQTAICCVVTL